LALKIKSKKISRNTLCRISLILKSLMHVSDVDACIKSYHAITKSSINCVYQFYWHEFNSLILLYLDYSCFILVSWFPFEILLIVSTSSKLRTSFILMFGNLYVIFYLKWMNFFFENFHFITKHKRESLWKLLEKSRWKHVFQPLTRNWKCKWSTLKESPSSHSMGLLQNPKIYMLSCY